MPPRRQAAAVDAVLEADEQPVDFRRQSDGFRMRVPPSALKGIVGGEDFEPYADYLARVMAPAAEPVSDGTESSGEGAGSEEG